MSLILLCTSCTIIVWSALFNIFYYMKSNMKCPDCFFQLLCQVWCISMIAYFFWSRHSYFIKDSPEDQVLFQYCNSEKHFSGLLRSLFGHGETGTVAEWHLIYFLFIDYLMTDSTSTILKSGNWSHKVSSKSHPLLFETYYMIFLLFPLWQLIKVCVNCGKALTLETKIGSPVFCFKSEIKFMRQNSIFWVLHKWN